MPTTADKRTRLVNAAVDLTYRQGFASTTIADVAAAADVPLGNVYYYFKTKEALGQAVVDQRLNEYRAHRRSWDDRDDARDRLMAFVRFIVESRQDLTRSGCPIGSLCTELHKTESPLAESARQLFEEMLEWLGDQFQRLGHEQESPDLALHLVSMLQGAIVLAQNFDSPSLLEREAERAGQWISEL